MSKPYPPEFKKEAVRMALESGKTKSSIAKDLGISVSLLYSWINQHNAAQSKGVSVDEHKAEQVELKSLKSKIKQLETENAILKKATAYFARDQL